MTIKSCILALIDKNIYLATPDIISAFSSHSDADKPFCPWSVALFTGVVAT